MWSIFFEDKTCTNKCTNKYRFTDSNECVNNCIKNGITFYRIGNFKSNDENVCQYSCTGENKYISNYNEANKDAYQCDLNCGNKYYYDDKKICMDSCDLLESQNSKKCVNVCADNQKVIISQTSPTPIRYCNNTCNNNNYIEKNNYFISSFNGGLCKWMY